ncbi:hypothetical protein Tco_1283028 [Tanacetum coccineum]
MSDGGVSIEEKPKISSHHTDSSNHIGGVSSEANEMFYMIGYSNSQPLLTSNHKALGTIENLSIDSVVVVPPKVDDPMLHTIKPRYDFDEADVDSYDDDYMSLFNDEEQPAKSSLMIWMLQTRTDIVDVKDRIIHLDLWIDLMWSLRPPKADWAIKALGGETNEEVLPDEETTLYLVMHGIFDSKGISADHYKITYNYASVPFQASLYFDCGIWVCIFIYRLCRNTYGGSRNDPLENSI